MALAAVVVLLLVSAINSWPGAAHATATLSGSHAKAGKSGHLTMQIPHGCNGTLATDKVTVRLSRHWKRVKPVAQQGWDSDVRRGNRGRHVITWTAMGEPLAANAIGDFKMKLRFPAKAGLYEAPTIQTCGDIRSKWNEPDRGGADGTHPYPAEFPVPKIKVRESHQ